MVKYTVRVTKDYGIDWADIDVEADDYEAAKKMALEEASNNGSQYFGPSSPSLYISQEDDDEEQSRAD